MTPPFRLSQALLHQWMLHAMQVAERSLPLDVPVGAVLLDETGRLVGEGWNTREALQNPLGHAELNVLQNVCQQKGQWRLTSHTLIVTLEPCPMCREALKQARVGQIIFGAFAKKGEDSSPEIARPSKSPLGGILEAENQARLEAYFQNKR